MNMMPGKRQMKKIGSLATDVAKKNLLCGTSKANIAVTAGNFYR